MKKFIFALFLCLGLVAFSSNASVKVTSCPPGEEMGYTVSNIPGYSGEAYFKTEDCALVFTGIHGGDISGPGCVPTAFMFLCI